MSKQIKRFEDLKVWQEGLDLSIQIYQTLRDCRDYGLRDQLQRSSVSIASNIAEGYERNSNKEFIQYLFIAKSSCGELRTQLYLCEKVGIIPRDESLKLLEKTKKISAMLYSLIQTRKTKFS